MAPHNPQNVDLNRNSVDSNTVLSPNNGYDEIDRTLSAPIAERGMPAIQAAINSGQREHPDGLFYAGRAPSWSHLEVRALLREHDGSCRWLAWIDLLTGLGPSGVGERVFAYWHDPVRLARVRWWRVSGNQPASFPAAQCA